jgi:hypothetical protein
MLPVLARAALLLDEVISLEDPDGATDAEWYRAYANAPNGEPFAARVATLLTNDVVVVPTLSRQKVPPFYQEGPLGPVKASPRAPTAKRRSLRSSSG